jgi:uncharacterized membrane protein
LVIASSQLFDDANNWMLYKYDDVDHLEYAYNLYHGNGLQKGVIDLEANTLEKNIPALKDNNQINTHLIGKNPLYFVLLGGWLYILNANFENWFYYGSIFNLILTAICIISFYALVKKFFSGESLLFAAPLLASMPGLIWYSVRIRPDILLFLLVIIAIYFGTRKFSVTNSILSGLFVGLAHFTHPLAVILGVSFLIYYLICKRIKSALLFFISWLILLVPWLIRNYLIFGDPIRGFGLPVPKSVLIYLGVASPDSANLNVYPEGLHGVYLIDTLRGMVDSFSNIYGMDYFLIFITLSFIAYICLASLKAALLLNNRNKFLFVLGLTIYIICIYYILTHNAGPINLIFSILIIFVIPFCIFLYLKLFSRYGDIFTSDQNQFYLLIGVYTVMNFVTYVMYTQITGRVTPEVRIILISLYLLLPLSVVGLRKIVNPIFYFMSGNHRKVVVSVLMAGLIIAFASYQAYTGISTIDSRLVDLAGKNYQISLNSWVKDNIPANSNIATDFPHLLTLQTGMNTVNFAHLYMDNTSYETWIIKKFDIDYLVFYYYKYNKKPLLYLDIGPFYLQKVYQGKEGGLIYKVLEK